MSRADVARLAKAGALNLSGEAKRGRGRAEGDRNQGAFVRARMAAKNDPDPGPAIEAAARDAAAGGLSVDEAAAAMRGAIYGAADRQREGESGDIDGVRFDDEPVSDDVAGWLALWSEYRDAFRKAQAVRSPTSRRQLHETGADLLWTGRCPTTIGSQDCLKLSPLVCTHNLPMPIRHQHPCTGRRTHSQP